jgi:inosine-uridine nucleoside N-ribohydrolase
MLLCSLHCKYLTNRLKNVLSHRLLWRYPELRSRIRIVLMGGTFERGNIHPTAEFNILHDPEAAHIVFHSGVYLTMIPLDLTHQVLVTEDILRKIQSLDTQFAKNMAGLVEFFRDSYQS